MSVSLLQFQSAFFVQVHAWVTAMSLKSKTLQPWETLKYHPVVTVPIERSKRPQTRSLQAPSKKLSLTPSASKPAHPTPSNKAAAGRSNQKQQSLSVALHTNASSLLPNTASPLRMDCAQNLLLGRVLNWKHTFCACRGTSGPVFHARYKHHTSTVIQMSNLLLIPVLVVPLAFACVCAL